MAGKFRGSTLGFRSYMLGVVRFSVALLSAFSEAKTARKVVDVGIDPPGDALIPCSHQMTPLPPGAQLSRDAIVPTSLSTGRAPQHAVGVWFGEG